jgi:hypothetical protein
MIKPSKSIITFKDPESNAEYQMELVWDGTDLNVETKVITEPEDKETVSITEVATHIFIGALRDGSKQQ